MRNIKRAQEQSRRSCYFDGRGRPNTGYHKSNLRLALKRNIHALLITSILHCLPRAEEAKNLAQAASDEIGLGQGPSQLSAFFADRTVLAFCYPLQHLKGEGSLMDSSRCN